MLERDFFPNFPGNTAVQQVVLADEAGGEPFDRSFVYVARCAFLDQFSVGDEGDTVGDGHRLFLVVGDVDEGDAHFLLDALELEAHFLPELGVQRSQWLIEQKNIALQHQRPGELHALLLAAGQLVGHPRAQAGETDQIEHPVHPVADHVLRQFLQFEPVGDVALDSHVGKQGVALEHHGGGTRVGWKITDVAAMQQHPARRGRDESADQPQQCRFATAAGAQQHEVAAAFDGEAHSA